MIRFDPGEQDRLHAELKDAVKCYEPRRSLCRWLSRVFGPKLERILAPVFTATVFWVTMAAGLVGLVVWLYVLTR